MTFSGKSKLILASGSKARRDLMEQAGLDFTVRPAQIDETAIIRDLGNKIPAADIALELARRKAVVVSEEDPLALVIGGDQILTCEGKIYQKVVTRDGVIMDLQALRGKKHQLISAVCVAHEAKEIWSHVDAASLTMKNLDDKFIKSYVESAGDSILHTVGGYELEGWGPWLFEKVEGDYFTILGLPLIPLLSFLQTKGHGP